MKTKCRTAKLSVISWIPEIYEHPTSLPFVINLPLYGIKPLPTDITSN